MSLILEIKNLHKIYNGTEIEVHAVNDVNLSFRKGEFTTLVGPSGSGKTTLLNMIGGLDRPSSGKIVINGIDIGELSSSKLIDFRMHHIGFVFQAYNLIPVLTAGENIEFIMRLQKRPKRERQKRVEELLKSIGLLNRIDSRPSRLSGGQQQRVAVARALASKPKFILADEPSASLDSASTETLLGIMKKLNRDENITFIFSTHDERVVRKAGRVITLEDGKVVSDEIR